MRRRDLQQAACNLLRAASGGQCTVSGMRAALEPHFNRGFYAIYLSHVPDNACMVSSRGALSSLRAAPFSAPCTPLNHYAFTHTATRRHSAAAATTEGLVISERAAERLRQLSDLSKGAPVYLRLSVEGGGCSGFSYEFSLDQSGPKEGDNTFEVHGAVVLCDDVSLELLRGATIDFESSLMRSAFVVRSYCFSVHILRYRKI